MSSNSDVRGSRGHGRRGPLTVVACNPYRDSKTKCDGARPKCQRCVDRDEVCVYVADPDMHPVEQLKAAIERLKQRIETQEAFFAFLITVSEANAFELLARLRRGEEIDSLVEAGQQMDETRTDPHRTLEPTVRRRASVDGFITSIPLDMRPVSEHFAAVVAGAPLTVLEPVVDLATNLRQLNAINSLRNSRTEGQTGTDVSERARGNSPGSHKE